MTFATLSVSDRIAWITLDRPPVNALATDSYPELKSAVDAAVARPDVSVIVLQSANPRVFCGGADIKELNDTLAIENHDEHRQKLARDAFNAILDAPVPTICALDGPAVGAGAVIAMCCDIRYASTAATLRLPEIDVARCGGGRHLMRALPQGKVRELYFTGAPLGAEEALRLGAFEKVVAGEDLEEAVAGLAKEIASKSPLALRVAKESLNACADLPLAEGYALEQTYTLKISGSEDAKEAARAFVERRPPVWTGR